MHAAKIYAVPQQPPLQAAPILKWAGGKTQLLPILEQNFPEALLSGQVDTYIEPFVGGAALFFHLASHYDIKKAYLFDINPELILLYNTLKLHPDALIRHLDSIEKQFLPLDDSKRRDFFEAVRNHYNTTRQENSETAHPLRAAQTIFLNRTCFNGLFRVNSRGGFNVPFGRYTNPRILFEDKLRAASAALQIADIRLADFSLVGDIANRNSFIYYDPPYRPISQTAQFTAYSKEAFDDKEQRRLSTLYRAIHARGASQLLSNSDPTNYINDPFFDVLYEGFNILRVDASRRINSKATSRGVVREILIKNYA